MAEYLKSDAGDDIIRVEFRWKDPKKKIEGKSMMEGTAYVSASDYRLQGFALPVEFYSPDYSQHALTSTSSHTPFPLRKGGSKNATRGIAKRHTWHRRLLAVASAFATRGIGRCYTWRFLAPVCRFLRNLPYICKANAEGADVASRRGAMKTDIMEKILIIEDDVRVAELLRTGLEEASYQTAVAYDGEMGLRLFRTDEFQLVISDIILPKLDGFELCREIRRANERVPILMLTALGSADDKLDGFDAGADDYMVKPFDFRELCARVKVLLRRGGTAPVQKAETLTYHDLVVDTSQHIVRRSDTEIKLSPKEYNLLVFMLENAERVISRVEIAEKVWSTHFDTGTNFIDVYINYLRKKIDRDFPQKLIHTKPGVGYILSAFK